MDPVGNMLWGGVEGPVWGRRVAEGRGGKGIKQEAERTKGAPSIWEQLPGVYEEPLMF